MTRLSGPGRIQPRAFDTTPHWRDVKGPEEMLRFRSSWMDLAGLMTILSVSGFAFFSYAPADDRRWLALGLLVAFACVQLLDSDRFAFGREHLTDHLVLAMLTVINLGLFWSDAEPFSVVILEWH